MYVWVCRSILNKLYTVTAPIVNEALWVGAHTAYLFSPNSVCNLLHSVDLPLPPIPRMQQPLLSSNLNSLIFLNTFFSGFSWIKHLVLGDDSNWILDSEILEILTSPISFDNFGSFTAFSTIIVSVKYL